MTGSSPAIGADTPKRSRGISGEHIDGREGTHYYGDACLGGHGELADTEAAGGE